jgi:hypothetical protein
MYRKLLSLYLTYLAAAAGLYAVSVVPQTRFIRQSVEQTAAVWLKLTARGLDIAAAPLRWVSYWQSGASRIADLENRLAAAVVDRQELYRLQTLVAALEATQALDNEFESSGSIVGEWVVGSDRGLAAFGGSGQAPLMGMTAVDAAGVLVGRVIRPGKYLVLIERLNDKGARVAVRVLGAAASGLLVGDGVKANLEGVLQEEPLQAGDYLVTSGADGIYPEGLVVGQVSAVDQDLADVTKGGSLELLGSFRGTLVLLPGSEDRL